MPLEKNARAVAPATRKSAAAQAERTEPHVAKRKGRRPSHAEHWTKVTVVLMDRQVIFVDRLVADIRAANGASLSRAHLIRALIDALADSDVDLTDSRSERDLMKLLAARLRGGRTTE
jgi:hypothetical protein